MQTSHKRGQEKLGKHGLEKCRTEKLFQMQGTVFFNIDWNNGQKNPIYLITDIYDSTELNNRLKEQDYKPETVFWEYTQL